MAQGQASSGERGERSQQSPNLNMASIAVRGFSQLYDMQVAAARLLLQSQARAATALGLPDYSGAFRVADDRAKRVFSESADQLLETAEHATQTLSEVQRQVGRLVERQTVSLADNWQRGVEEFSEQAEQGLEQLSETTRRQVEEAERAAQAMADQARRSAEQSKSREGRSPNGHDGQGEARGAERQPDDGARAAERAAAGGTARAGKGS